jgi:membrane protease YdiL (CAAX protease family)
MGLYLGGLLLATDSLLVPVLVHGLYDLVALLVVRALARR